MATRKKVIKKRTAAKRVTRRKSSKSVTLKPTRSIIENEVKNQGEIIIAQNPMMMSDLFKGDRYDAIRRAIIDRGYWDTGTRRVHMQTRKVGDDYEILAVGATVHNMSTAAIDRDPGLSQEFIDNIQDFLTSTRSHDIQVQNYWNIYRTEGIINNAINKIAAIIGGDGTFKIRHTKQGRKKDASDNLLKMLDTWKRDVNRTVEEGVLTGQSGLQAVTHQIVRMALIEGDFFGRTVWTNYEVLDVGTTSLPMNIQALSSRNMEPVDEGLGGVGELFYWVPPTSLVQLIRDPDSKEIRQLVKKLFGTGANKILSDIKKEGKALLDRSLLIHVKHRGTDISTWGESMISPTISALAYKRSLLQLDTVSMRNLINRLTIVMVGSSDPASPYSKAEVATARMQLMQTFFEDTSPNMIIIWAGDDVTVQDVGAHNSILDLDDRNKLARSDIRDALGVPEALLSGATTDGKAAGWAAHLGASAQLEELLHTIAEIYTSIGLRIALENGFEDTDLVFEFDNSLLVDKAEEHNQNRNDYMAGLISIQTFLAALGRDPGAEYLLMLEEKGLEGDVTWIEAFAPPQGLQGQGEGKTPGEGRTPDSNTGKTSPERNKESKTPVENK